MIRCSSAGLVFALVMVALRDDCSKRLFGPSRTLCTCKNGALLLCLLCLSIAASVPPYVRVLVPSGICGAAATEIFEPAFPIDVTVNGEVYRVLVPTDSAASNEGEVKYGGISVLGAAIDVDSANVDGSADEAPIEVSVNGQSYTVLVPTDQGQRVDLSQIPKPIQPLVDSLSVVGASIEILEPPLSIDVAVNGQMYRVLVPTDQGQFIDPPASDVDQPPPYEGISVLGVEIDVDNENVDSSAGEAPIEVSVNGQSYTVLVPTDQGQRVDLSQIPKPIQPLFEGLSVVGAAMDMDEEPPLPIDVNVNGQMYRVLVPTDQGQFIDPPASNVDQPPPYEGIAVLGVEIDVDNENIVVGDKNTSTISDVVTIDITVNGQVFSVLVPTDQGQLVELPQIPRPPDSGGRISVVGAVIDVDEMGNINLGDSGAVNSLLIDDNSAALSMPKSWAYALLNAVIWIAVCFLK